MANRVFIVISNSNIQHARMPTKNLNDIITGAFGSWVRRKGDAKANPDPSMHKNDGKVRFFNLVLYAILYC
jgi:hypothetical protein